MRPPHVQALFDRSWESFKYACACSYEAERLYREAVEANDELQRAIEQHREDEAAAQLALTQHLVESN